MQMFPFPPEEFAARRSQVFDRIGPKSLACLQGAGPVRGFEVFRQTNEFFYLGGVEVPQAYLLLDGRTRTTTLFLPPPDAHAAGEGVVNNASALRKQSGVDAIADLPALSAALVDAEIIYTPHAPAEGRLSCRDTLTHSDALIAADPWDAAPSREQRFIQTLQEGRPGLLIQDLSPLLDDLRLIKSPREVALMRRAGRLCALAVREAIRSTRPGVREYELDAVADYLYRVNGARGEGYRAIIACGPNIWHAHYYRNDATLEDGQLVLMDYAPDVSNYTSDIGRQWPVNGQYSPVQRELYGFVVSYHKTLLRRLRPGVLPRQVLTEAAEEMEPVITQTAFSQPIYEQAARRMLTFTGHLSHPVGMAVHDVGSYFERPLTPGLVFALDPQMWVPEERLYVRVEDTVAITTDGVEVLTDACPLEFDAVEALIGSEGLLQRFPPITEENR